MADYPPKMQFDNGVDYILTIADDPKPYVHEKYGEQMIYNFSHEGVMKTHFASGKAMGLLTQFKVGDTVKMGKHKDGEYWVFHVELHEGGAEQPKHQGDPGVQVQPTSQVTQDWNLINSEKDWHISKKTAMNCAVSLQHGERNAESLKDDYQKIFSILNDNEGLVISLMADCHTLEELGALWKKLGRLWLEILSPEEVETIQRYKEMMKDSFTEEPVKKEPLHEKLPF